MVQSKPIDLWAKLAQESSFCVPLTSAKHSPVIQKYMSPVQ